jgi:hypothetical protein
MSISEADLDAKRRRAAELRSEISSIHADTASVHSVAADAIASAELDAEIARLERERDDALHHQIGSVEHAKAMLEKAVAVAEESDTAEPIEPVEVADGMDKVEPAPTEDASALERARAGQAAAEEVTQANEEAKKAATPASVAKRSGGSK